MVGNSTATPLDHPARAAQAASAKLLDLAKQITLGRYFAGVALTLALYDWIILLEQESRYVWNTRWRLTKGIYYYNRVMSLIGLGITVLETTDQWTNELPISLYVIPHSDNLISSRLISFRFPLSSCKTYFLLVGLIEWSGFFGGNVILTLRVVAMYNNQHPNLVRFLYAYLLVTWMTALAFTVHTLSLLSLQTFYSMDFHLCASSSNPPLTSYIFLVAAIFEMILFGLTLYRAIQDVRNRVLVFRSSREVEEIGGGGDGGASSPLLVVLYRDGLYYFAAVFAVYLWIAIAYLTQEIKSTYMGVYLGWAISIVMSCRVYLNLAHAVHDRRTMYDQSTTHHIHGHYTNSNFHMSTLTDRPPRRYPITTDIFALDMYGDKEESEAVVVEYGISGPRNQYSHLHASMMSGLPDARPFDYDNDIGNGKDGSALRDV